jgi:hypothetical protein
MRQFKIVVWLLIIVVEEDDEATQALPFHTKPAGHEVDVIIVVLFVVSFD